MYACLCNWENVGMSYFLCSCVEVVMNTWFIFGSLVV
jgi:hypothetical protein